ncbi:ribonuclease P protein subunit Rpp30 [Methanobrevibacter gottschalkii]|uniref:Ribonuclease P protein component 3 n=2 Tax=Methanobrevibacter gottschalkii TaxID=190974 RepID=A0A3N5C3G6_9EURY|nr:MULTISPECIES: RNase P subunit p30 family protein [Methanobrevibacter]MCQ2971346.1 ribonuclease P [archaeon]OED00633.1 ribonuclease P [Methanobrevibacter sp. A27]RPF50831.1 ribonuclease P protein subunit Rpp30 [Methanobrevibacter gottschalkii DSM 11977]SEK46239.1 ribonuclease P protein subunit Rpp30 [Methanobrevibacter gottschalkii]
MFFDLNIKGSTLENNIKLAKEASFYGWNHINFSYNANNFLNALNFKDELNKALGDIIDFDYTLEIKSSNINDIRKSVNKFRNRSSCISVVGGDLKVNRATLENIKIDVLSRPYLRRYDCGLNHVLAKEAEKNNVAVELCFKDVLKSYLSYRSKILSNFKDIYTLYRKFDFPLVLSSRAESVFDIRTTHDFITFFKQTGLTDAEINKSFKTADNILKYNKNRENLILKGVMRVTDET